MATTTLTVLGERAALAVIATWLEDCEQHVDLGRPGLPAAPFNLAQAWPILRAIAEPERLADQDGKAQAEDWRPIETAPRDGTWLLLCVGGWVPLTGHWFSDPMPGRVLAQPRLDGRLHQRRGHPELPGEHLLRPHPLAPRPRRACRLRAEVVMPKLVELTDDQYQHLADVATDAALTMIIGLHRGMLVAAPGNGAPILQGVITGLVRFMAEASTMDDAAIRAFIGREVGDVLPQVRMALAAGPHAEGRA